ncbi:MAG: hypothetical protein EAX95_07220 [Candidatus Thorarchaeota archaeon]|nr:hypothetical protein [Candidatus Thorarchaeota archaeon]
MNWLVNWQEVDVKQMEDDEKREEINWFEYGDHETSRHPPLDRTDYLAIFIASLQTIFLPFIIFAVVLVSIGMLFAIMP